MLEKEIPNPQTIDQIDILRASDLFNETWFLHHYPQVKANMDPLRYYLEYGVVELLDPGPNFSTRNYLLDYPDIKEAGINPLFHYLKFGRSEGRVLSKEAWKIQINPFKQNKLRSLCHNIVVDHQSISTSIQPISIQKPGLKNIIVIIQRTNQNIQTNHFFSPRCLEFQALQPVAGWLICTASKRVFPMTLIMQLKLSSCTTPLSQSKRKFINNYVARYRSVWPECLF